MRLLRGGFIVSGACIWGLISAASVATAQDLQTATSIMQAEQSKAAAAQSKGVRGEQNAYTVLIYGDEATFSPDLAGREIRFLEKTYNLPVIAYAARSPKEFLQVFSIIGRNHFRIQNLILRGFHGGTYESIPSLTVMDLDHDDFADVSFDEMVKAAGGPLNFTSTAFLFLDSCTMIEKETLPSIRTAMTEVRKLGLTSGWLYLNHEEGSYGVENTFLVPFYDVKTAKGKLQHAAAQAIWPVLLPYFAYLDRFKKNHGYLLGVSENHELLIKTHAFDAEKGERTGTLVSFK